MNLDFEYTLFGCTFGRHAGGRQRCGKLHVRHELSKSGMNRIAKGKGKPPLCLDQPARYRIKVQGRLDADWSAWFDGLTVTVAGGGGDPSVTSLTGLVTDQAALHGLLARIRDLGLPLLLVECLEPQQRPEYATRMTTPIV